MIDFFTEDITYSIDKAEQIKKWVLACFSKEDKQQEISLSIIFCSDEALLKINKQFLQHDYYTDIITFTLEETSEILEAELYISIDRVKDNALKLKKEFLDELHRVIIHGTLHLCGYQDKNEQEQKTMRAKEDYYLNQRNF